MKRLINFSFFIILFMFVFYINASAECSYEERKDLLNDAKKLDITISPKMEIIKTTGTTSFSEEPITIETEKYSFDFIISGLKDSMYLTYYNSLTEDNGHVYYENLKDGIYTFNVENSSDILTFYFELYSLNENCSNELFYTKKVVKPMYNSFSEYSICQNELVSSKDFCKKFISKKLNMSESQMLEKANKLIEESSKKVEKASFSFLDFIKNYWYVFASVLVFVVIIFVVIFVKKKREELV